MILSYILFCSFLFKFILYCFYFVDSCHIRSKPDDRSVLAVHNAARLCNISQQELSDWNATINTKWDAYNAVPHVIPLLAEQEGGEQGGRREEDRGEIGRGDADVVEVERIAAAEEDRAGMILSYKKYDNILIPFLTFYLFSPLSNV